MRETKPVAITSPYAPDANVVRVWIETKIKAGHFVALVTAIVALVMRMRQINLDLVARVAHMKRRRPASETLARLQRQLVLPLFEQVEEKKKRDRGRATETTTRAAARCPITCGASSARTPLPIHIAAAPCAGRKWNLAASRNAASTSTSSPRRSSS